MTGEQIYNSAPARVHADSTEAVCTISQQSARSVKSQHSQFGTFLADIEDGLCDGQQRQRLLRDEEHAVTAHLGEHNKVGEEQRPERTYCAPLNAAQVPAEYPVTPGRAQDKGLHTGTRGYESERFRQTARVHTYTFYFNM